MVSVYVLRAIASNARFYTGVYNFADNVSAIFKNVARKID
jgi:hypothetical protein